ncbi:Trk system potassium uptake protein trkG [uncultured Roseburia sp.]|uniref:TrkH family potassium uptake protein n=1 Tax=Brotonthovivens ammoniilytica TaxID=2981725 RepID=A0ABT2TKL8_9FIRM|nr:TrkH family potassium uptake protein [Brotonthovivens ammoniilytica]MCU6762758.1 TrkH family potassium uptake protein [Brotonthovivens ammoniilytica]SCI87640.1 Trk system potassium uptake protein trkG [uncultured Roseburia sp.]
MNVKVIRYILGYVLKLEALFLILPCIVAVIYKETTGFYYLFVLILCGLLGFLMSRKKPDSFVFYLKEGCIATALSWIVLSLFGGLPFWLSGEIPSFVDTLFETVSGFTTTGASILSDVEALSRCSLFWRSFTHWIGGMGVLVFLLAIVPLSGGSHINLMRAESPGPSVGKLVPKLRHTARILYLIYLGMTILEVIFLLAGHMSLFDALTTSFGTAGTGGFGIKNDSMMSYSPYLQWVVTIFMILFGVNFNAYYLILFRRFRKALQIEEVKYYIIIILVSIGIIFINIYNTVIGSADALRHASFQVASIITTTGFATTDFNLWPQTSKTILVLLMFIGACAGSTGGGIKVSRFVILLKTVGRELNSYIHPKSIKKIKIEGKPIDPEVVRATNVFFITFVIIFSFSVFAISFEGKDLITNFTAVAATINNIGPGLELVGPTQNFGGFRPFSKCVLIFDMLAGRLELFPLLILFHPAVWKDLFFHRSGAGKKHS